MPTYKTPRSRNYRDFVKAGMLEKVREIVGNGATTAELCSAINVNYRTYLEWKKEHPEFLEAINLGGEDACDKVEKSLFQQSNGFYVEEEIEFRGKVVKTKKYLKPNIMATTFFLKNRRPNKWKDNPSGNEETLNKVQELLDSIKDNL